MVPAAEDVAGGAEETGWVVVAGALVGAEAGLLAEGC